MKIQERSPGVGLAERNPGAGPGNPGAIPERVRSPGAGLARGDPGPGRTRTTTLNLSLGAGPGASPAANPGKERSPGAAQGRERSPGAGPGKERTLKEIDTIISYFSGASRDASRLRENRPCRNRAKYVYACTCIK